ncbi:MAG: carboxypeptidase-like regulatory domain-containing protein, partial [Pseudomonadota bacterium]
SSPIVTENGVIVVGNNLGRTHYAIKDNGTEGVLLDTLSVDPDGEAEAGASATISPDGRLYLPLRTTWAAGNGDGETPTYAVTNLFCALDITAGAVAVLYPPSGMAAVALNNAVSLSWKTICDPAGQFDHYAVYRSSASFTSVEGMTPIGTVSGIDSTNYRDDSAENGTGYHYAVTTVALGGGEVKEVKSAGPRTPRDETDLQVVCISRTPRYPRYAPIYTYYEITEPSGFGPYIFSAATGLGQGQTPETRRWPHIGDPVTYTATIRNRGTNTWNGTLEHTWELDGVSIDHQSPVLTVEPGVTAAFSVPVLWDGLSHSIAFSLDDADARLSNNRLAVNTKSVPFLTYVDLSYLEDFREVDTPRYPDAATGDIIDWMNRHMTRFNSMFENAGCQKRVHYDLLEVLNDGDPDPAIDRLPFGIFPFRFHAGEPSYRRQSAYYRPAEDIDYGFLHEMGHQLGLIDLYQLGIPAESNQVSGTGYSGPDCLMNSCNSFISAHSAMAMNLWLDQAHGYYGQYMYGIPAEMRLRVLDCEGKPLAGAAVGVYQFCERPGQGKVITGQIKAEGVTDANGEFVLPNVPIDPDKVPPIQTGDELHANPFGYLAVVGTNGVLHFRVEYDHAVDYAWLDVTEANIAYWTGQTGVSVFERQLALGGPSQYCPPADMAEVNSGDWVAWAEGSSSGNTYVEDDAEEKLFGESSLKFTTNGGFDTYVRYPRTFAAHWDLSAAQHLNISFYAVNPHGFQSGSPWIRLKGAENSYFEYQYYQNGEPCDLLQEACSAWQTYQVPLDAAPDAENGWRCTPVGSPDMSDVRYLEIHADTWEYGFTLWIDGVSFDPQPPCPCAFDSDGDGDVDGADLADFVRQYAAGAFGKEDLAAFADSFGKTGYRQVP